MLKKDQIDFDKPFDSLELLLKKLKEDLLMAGDSFLSDTIVFSPGATSFGMFANEFDRGNKFMNLVKEIFA